MTPIRAILFDIGGVLVRTVDRAPRTGLAANLGTTYEALEELVFGGESGRRAQRGEISAAQQWRYVCEQLGWPLEQAEQLEQAFFGGDVLDAALVALIRSLRPAYKTGVISNAFDNLRTLLHQWAIAEEFDHIAVSAELGCMKPDERIYVAALQGLDITAQSAVFVDDMPRNVAAAQALGMQAIQYRSTPQLVDELRALLAK